MVRVALTGGIATGKSYVLARFADHDVPTVDADVVARDVVRPGRPAWTALRRRFGPDMFAEDGALDRKRLASHAFDDPVARADLEAIVHPHVRSAIDDWFRAVSTDSEATFAIAGIPLLFETNRAGHFDRIIVTACDRATQLSRLMTRDTLSEEEGLKRLAAQLPTTVKTSGADFVIHTDGSFDDTTRQVDDVFRALHDGEQ